MRNLDEFRGQVKNWSDHALVEEGKCLVWHAHDHQTNEELMVVTAELRTRNRDDLIKEIGMCSR